MRPTRSLALPQTKDATASTAASSAIAYERRGRPMTAGYLPMQNAVVVPENTSGTTVHNIRREKIILKLLDSFCPIVSVVVDCDGVVDDCVVVVVEELELVVFDVELEVVLELGVGGTLKGRKRRAPMAAMTPKVTKTAVSWPLPRKKPVKRLPRTPLAW